jgi:hypothetical protein
MEPISHLGRVMGLLRARQAQTGRRDGAASPASAPQGKSALPPDLQGAVVERLRQVELDTPQGERQGIRVFLETVLRGEFGDAMLASPRFSDLVDEVQTALASDAELKAELLELLRGMRPVP